MAYLILLKQKYKIIAIIVGVFTLLSLLLSLIRPLEYSASNKLIVIQPTNINIDAYSAIKSVERISEKLADIVYTTSFYDKVMSSNYNIDKTYFKSNEKKKRKQWQKMVSTQVVRGSGMIKLQVYHTDKSQAYEILGAITHVFNKNGWEYLGSMNITIFEIDKPLISNWPIRPNFILNGLFGLLFGLIFGIGYVLVGSYGGGWSGFKIAIKCLVNKIDGDPLCMDKSRLVRTDNESVYTNNNKSLNTDINEQNVFVDNDKVQTNNEQFEMVANTNDDIEIKNPSVIDDIDSMNFENINKSNDRF